MTGVLLGLLALGATWEYYSLRKLIFKASKPRTRLLDKAMVLVCLAACVSSLMLELVEESQSFKSGRSWMLGLKVLEFIVTPLCTLILPLVEVRLKGADGAAGQSVDPHVIVPYVTRWLADWGFINLISSTVRGMLRIRKSVDGAGRQIGVSKMVFVIMTPWVGDAGALLIGGKIGRLRIIPSISPNKTLEGYLGLAIFSLISTFGMRYVGWTFYPHHRFNLFHRTANPYFLALVSIISAAASAVGDLVESTLKRIAGVKDTSNIFGPHGGVLDKVDAIMIATVCLSHLIA